MNYNMLCVQTSAICIVFLIFLYYFNIKSEYGVRNMISRCLYGAVMLLSAMDIVCVFFSAYSILKLLCFALVCVLWVLYVADKCKKSKDTPKKTIVFWECIYMIPVPVAVLLSVVFCNMYSLVAFAVTLGLMIGIINSQHKTLVTDNLTKLQNRYGMDEEIEVQLGQYRKDNNDSFYAIVCDLDNFKTINDTWGHLEGDRALKMVADVLTDVAKKYDSTAFRMGGDEFVIITDKSDENLADNICDEIKNRFENLDFRDDFDIRMSMGVSLYDGKHSIQQLIQNADMVLYEMKRKAKGE